MQRKEGIDLTRHELLMRVRSEAGIIRFWWLNDVLPEAEKEFDRRVQAGETLNIDEIIKEAIFSVESRSLLNA